MSPNEALEMAWTTRKLVETSQSQLEEIKIGTQWTQHLLADARTLVERIRKSLPPPDSTGEASP